MKFSVFHFIFILYSFLFYTASLNKLSYCMSVQFLSFFHILSLPFSEMRQNFSPAVPTAHGLVAKGLTAYAEIVLTAQGHIIIIFLPPLSPQEQL